jgi:hypothetical protein
LRIALAALAFAVAGCATRRMITLDAQNPSLRVSTQGVLFGDKYVKPTEAVEILLDYDIPKTSTIHILLDADVKNLSQARFLMACLARAGYTRPVLVTRRHAESKAVGPRKKTASSPTGTKK